MCKVHNVGGSAWDHAAPSRQTVLQLGGSQPRRQLPAGGQREAAPLAVGLDVQHVLQRDAVQLALAGEQEPCPLLPQGDHTVQRGAELFLRVRLLNVVRGVEREGVHRVIRAGRQEKNVRIFAAPENVPRQLRPQHTGHTNVQQDDIRTAGLLEGVQHRKGGGIDGRLDAVLLMRGRVNAEVLRDPLAVPGVVVANGYFQHRPASFAVFSVLYTAACRFASGRLRRIQPFCGLPRGALREVHCISRKKNAQAKRLRIVGIVGHPWVEPQKVLAEIKIE